MDLCSITLALLAGGESSRMGKSKAALQIGGKFILDYLLDRFAWPGPTMLVTAPGREVPPGGERFSSVAVDPVTGQGPLRGFLTALERSTTTCTIIAAVDMPMIGFETLQFLARQLELSLKAPGVALRWADPSRPPGKGIESMPCGIRESAKSHVQKVLHSDRPSIRNLIATAPFTIVDAPADWPAETWTNLNFPADFEEFRTISPDRR